MSDRTGIEWTDATWNPIRGCSRVSEGCRNCYAEAVAARFSGPGQAYAGLARRRSNGEPQWTGEVLIVENHLYDPLRWREPRRIFVNSMSDLFHEQLVIDDIAHIFAVMALAPRHTFQVLTKRAAAMQEVLSHPDWFDILNAHIEEIAFAHSDPHNRRRDDLRATAPEIAGPLPNVWLGVSTENQETANERIPQLLQTPAAVRFLSCEPLLGSIDFYQCGSRGGEDGDPFAFSALRGTDGVEPPIPGVDWVILGGESGRNARPMDIGWLRSIVCQCKNAGVAVFVKQLGKWIAGDETGFFPQRWLFENGDVWVPGVVGEHNYRRPAGAIAFGLTDQKGGDIDRWPDDLRIREFPATEVRVP